MAKMDIASLFSLTGKVALVTGGSRGIGRMMAEGLLRAGAAVYISARTSGACERTADELAALGRCVALPANVATADGRAALVEAMGAREDRLHILINNAGAAWGAPYAEYPESAWDKLLDLNVKAPFLLTRDLTPLLERAATDDDPARVIIVGSIDGIHVPQLLEAGTFAYGASKAAVHHLAKTLAVELGPRRITVNAVAPGFFESQMTARHPLHTRSEHRRCLSARSHRPCGGHGRHRRLSGVARRRVHERRRHPGRRRDAPHPPRRAGGRKTGPRLTPPARPTRRR